MNYFDFAQRKRKGFAYVLFILILLIGIGVAVYLTQFTQIFKPKAFESKLCTANSADSFRLCIGDKGARLRSGEINVIEIQNMIDCPRVGDGNACSFRIENVNGPILITGKKGVAAGFRRTDWFTGGVLLFDGSRNIYISNLIFDDNKAKACRVVVKWNVPQGQDPVLLDECRDQGLCTRFNCNSPLGVFNSSNVTLDNLRVEYFKKHGIELENSENVIVQNSVIRNGGGNTQDPQVLANLEGRPDGSGEYAIHIDGGPFKLINNQLIDILSNAVGIDSIGTSGNRSKIKGNLFTNSAGWDLYDSGGGTVGIIPPLIYVDIENNEIKDAKFAKFYWYTSVRPRWDLTNNGGIEIDVLPVESINQANVERRKLNKPDIDPYNQNHDVNILGNVIHNIQGDYGIGIGNKQFYSNFNISKNVIYNIQALPNHDPATVGPVMLYAPGTNINYNPANNCLNNPLCPIPAYSTFTAFPDVCFEVSGKCASTIRWSSKSLGNLSLKNHATGVPLGTAGANGSYDFSWKNDGEGVDLIANGKVINSFIVSGGKLVETPPYKGNILATPATCANPQNCQVRIDWDVSGIGSSTEIYANGALFKTGGVTGSVVTPWSASGVKFDLYVDGSLYDSITVQSQTTASPSPSPSPSAPPVNKAPIGVFDGVFGTQLIGWACDLDVPSTALFVHVYIDDQFGWVATADKTGEAGIAPHCGGFKDRRIITDIPEKYKDGKAHSVKIYALDNLTTSSGINTLLNGSPKTFTLQPPPPTGTLTASPNPCQTTATQSVCTSTISWNVNNPGTGRIIVKVRSSGGELGGDTPSGSADATGVSTAGETLDLYSGTTLLSSITVRGVRVNSPPKGIFDGVFGSQLLGWACDLDTPSAPINVEYYIDDQPLAFVLADRPGAAGIASNCGGFPDRRFIIDIPNQYKDGKPHTAKVFGVDNLRFVAPRLLNGSPKTFNLPAPKIGDLNPPAGGDGNVDMADFNIFARYYKDKNLRADFNGNGKVDLADLNMLIRNFGQ